MLLYPLENTIQSYDWGHPDHIRQFLGTKESVPPVQAELWMGAHPRASSRVRTKDGSEELLAMITRDPEQFLGSRALAAGWTSLPFLFKLLAAGKPLSIQSHPDLASAKTGFARENAQGLALSASNRNYKDDNHKPEIIVALSDFYGLCGFRPASEIARDFDDLASFGRESGSQDLALTLGDLSATAKSGDYKLLTRKILSLGNLRPRLVDLLVRYAATRTEERFKWLSKAAEDFPGDAGLFFFMALKLLALKPGESFFAPAGVLHAYLSGFGLELMANSDNVLRGGLSPKHIDVEELLANLDVDIQAGMLVPIRKDGIACYAPPVSEFRLDLVEANKVLLLSGSAEIWLVTEGSGDLIARGLDGSEERLALERGQSVFVAPACKELCLAPGMVCARAYIP